MRDTFYRIWFTLLLVGVILILLVNISRGGGQKNPPPPTHRLRLIGILIALLLLSGCATVPQKYEISPRAANNLWFLYDRLQTEFAFCAYGTNDGNTVTIEKVDLPFITSADTNMVWYRECGGTDFLGMGHSHLAGVPCRLSETDIETLMRTNTSFSFLVCDDKQLRTFSKREVKNAVEKASAKPP